MLMVKPVKREGLVMHDSAMEASHAPRQRVTQEKGR